MVKKEPKYRMIQKELQEEIISDNYICGDRFYSEAELCTRYQVSSITVIRALKELEKLGILLESKVLVLLYPNLVKKRSLNFQILKIPQQSKML